MLSLFIAFVYTIKGQYKIGHNNTKKFKIIQLVLININNMEGEIMDLEEYERYRQEIFVLQYEEIYTGKNNKKAIAKLIKKLQKKTPKRKRESNLFI